jgi:hypothetical protein
MVMSGARRLGTGLLFLGVEGDHVCFGRARAATVALVAVR